MKDFWFRLVDDGNPAGQIIADAIDYAVEGYTQVTLDVTHLPAGINAWYRWTGISYVVDEALKQAANPPTAIAITADKLAISADGIDTATVTATIPPDLGNSTAYLLLNGLPVTEEPIVDGQVVIEVTATTPGPVAVEAVVGSNRGIIILNAVGVV